MEGYKKFLIYKKNRSAIETVIFGQVECKENKYFIYSIKTLRDEINNVQ